MGHVLCLYQTSIEVRAEPRDQIFLRQEACHTFFQLTTFEKQQRGDSHYSELHDEVGVFIRVDLYNLNFSIPFASELLHDWIQHLAWLTPYSTKIHKHGLG